MRLQRAPRLLWLCPPGGLRPPVRGSGGHLTALGLQVAKSAPPPWCAPVGAVFKRRRSRRLLVVGSGAPSPKQTFYIYAPNGTLAQIHYILCRKGVTAAWNELRNAPFLYCDLMQRPKKESARTASTIGATKSGFSDKLHNGKNFLLTRVFESSKKAIF